MTPAFRSPTKSQRPVYVSFADCIVSANANGTTGDGSVDPRFLTLTANPSTISPPPPPHAASGNHPRSFPAPAASAETPPLIFGPYACHLPTFDLDQLADGLYDRDRTFAPPPNDNVDAVIQNAEAFVKRVRDIVTAEPISPSFHELIMRDQFVQKARRIENRDLLVTQVAAEIVRSVIKLHTLEDEGARTEEVMVENEEGEIVEGRVAVANQRPVIGDHLRPDQIEDLQPRQIDYWMTATARLDNICNVLAQTKTVARDALDGKDAIARIVAAPYQAQADMYVGQL